MPLVRAATGARVVKIPAPLACYCRGLPEAEAATPFSSLHLGPDGLQGRERLAFFPGLEHLLNQQPLHGREAELYGAFFRRSFEDQLVLVYSCWVGAGNGQSARLLSAS